MTYCPKCGKSLPDDATVCSACGATFDPIPDPDLIFDPPQNNQKTKKTKSSSKSPEVRTAFQKWAHDQGMFCLIAKAVAVTVMVFYLLTAIVSVISLIANGNATGGAVFSTFFLDVLAGIVYGVIIWLLSDAVLYLQKLYEMKKEEPKKQ